MDELNPKEEFMKYDMYDRGSSTPKPVVAEMLLLFGAIAVGDNGCTGTSPVYCCVWCLMLEGGRYWSSSDSSKLSMASRVS